MRHRKNFNHLGRTSSHRKAMLSNMATSLILHKRISTTVAKAKALRTYVEPLITKSKEDTTHSRRVVFSYLQSKEAVTELFREISPKIAERPGGYTRIIKTEYRLGDNADMCLMELVDFNDVYVAKEGAATEKGGRRRRRGSGKARKEEVAAPPVAETPALVAEKVEPEKVEEETPEAVAELQPVEEQVVETPEASVDETAPATDETEEKKPE